MEATVNSFVNWADFQAHDQVHRCLVRLIRVKPVKKRRSVILIVPGDIHIYTPTSCRNLQKTPVRHGDALIFLRFCLSTARSSRG